MIKCKYCGLQPDENFRMQKTPYGVKRLTVCKSCEYEQYKKPKIVGRIPGKTIIPLWDDGQDWSFLYRMPMGYFRHK